MSGIFTETRTNVKQTVPEIVIQGWDMQKWMGFAKRLGYAKRNGWDNMKRFGYPIGYKEMETLNIKNNER